MNMPVPTKEQRRSVVLARWKLRKAMSWAVDSIKVRTEGCQCEVCVDTAGLYGTDEEKRRFQQKTAIQGLIKKIRANEHGHYLAHSHDNETLVSYSRNELTKFLPERRVKLTLGKYVRRNFPESGINDEFLEEFCVKTMSLLQDSKKLFRIVSGEDITRAYTDEIGGHSCMTGDCSKYVKIYEINPDVVSMLIYQDSEMTGRCLVWKTNQGHIVTDRIYPNSGRHIELYNQFIADKGWHRRSDNSAPSSQYFIGLENEHLTVTLKIPDPPVYPYMDTFKDYRHSDVNWNSRTITLNTEGSHNWLHYTDGYGPGCEEDLECYECGDRVSEDDRCGHDGRDYCQSCFDRLFSCCDRCSETVRCDDLSEVHRLRNGRSYTSEWCYDCRQDTFTCYQCDEVWRDEDMVEVEGDCYCPECAEDNSSCCADCGDQFLSCNLESIDGDFVCSSCAEERAENDADTSDEDECKDEEAAEVETVA